MQSRTSSQLVALFAVVAVIATACADDGETDAATNPEATTATPTGPSGESPQGTEQEAQGGSETDVGAAGLTVTEAPDVEPPEDAPFRQSPWWPYLSAHIDDEQPRDVLVPIEISGTQEQGQVNWVLPGPRELDPTIFGTPDDPRGTEVPAALVGVPPPGRTVTEDGTYQTAGPTPFSDEAATVEGRVDLTVVDATATDAAVTKDQIDFEATFTGPDGAEYRVTVERPAPHGWFIPTAGGVITNFIQHGVTGWGTRLMPTEYDDLAFYGPGTLFRDGEMIAEGRPTHVMLTEFVRGEGYELVHDDAVNPGGRHMHLMMAPFDAFGRPDPVPTGFTLPNGKDQPFLHIMFPSFEVTGAGALSSE